ncbi:MAG: signal recognition particle-docking protein FtsY [Solobacterium sp.]|nr:signal recognition particle-docking protein FtsY [Solobacterium sp.]MDY2952680.1 signal recognition particle-docking protein FtsY [Erysipelotrichaceae bacterium]MCI6877476.1 signal recognition particle-docking protein FtsY [Solobacterium sp.]MCI7156087.1 signal recognition particle-docking protein FtsY [Solobacterium sp.]MDD5801215.1 signal recognition particle-docking protein FtsY [Solobacterium sp.]
MGFLDSLKQAITGKKDTGKYLSGFAKTNNALGRKLKFITENNTKNKEDFVEQLMITLIESDIGYKTSEDICDRFFKETQDYLYLRQEDVMDILLETFDDIYNEKKDNEIVYNEDGPTVILMVGVNGSGKTSTCAKLAKMYKEQGKKVCLAAADTFRAGAIEQLREWANRLDVDFVAGKEQEDPSSVLVNACRYAKENNVDILLCDTAGRLQTKVNLMAELAKMRRVVGKEIPGAPHNVWMVLDANTGQNGMSQATLFNEVTDLTGIILTKMDGTSKGGIVIAIKNVLGIPVRFITLGETADDIKPFDFDLYLYSIIGDGDVR